MVNIHEPGPLEGRIEQWPVLAAAGAMEVRLAETDLEGALCVAERRRDAVASSQDFLRVLTISAGGAAAGSDGIDSEQLVLRADQALYQAKGEGRNRVAAAR